MVVLVFLCVLQDGTASIKQPIECAYKLVMPGTGLITTQEHAIMLKLYAVIIPMQMPK